MPNIIYPEQEKYLSELRNQDSDLTNEMEEFAKLKKIPILGWNSSIFLEQMISIHKPKRVLEIGTAIAYSTIKVARTLSDEATIDTIELSKVNINLAKGFIERAGLNNKINILEGNALHLMKELKPEYDFIFLDADKEDYKELFLLSLGLLNPNGIMFIDNLLWQGFAANADVPEKFITSTENIREFNKLFMKTESLFTNIIPVGDGIGIGIKKS